MPRIISSAKRSPKTPLRTKILFVFGLGVVLLLTAVIIKGSTSSFNIASRAAGTDPCYSLFTAYTDAQAKVKKLQDQEEKCTSSACFDRADAAIATAITDASTKYNNYDTCQKNNGQVKQNTPTPELPANCNKVGVKCPSQYACNYESGKCLRVDPTNYTGTVNGQDCRRDDFIGGKHVQVAQNDRCENQNTICDLVTGSCKYVQSCSALKGVCLSSCSQYADKRYIDHNNGFCSNMSLTCCTPQNQPAESDNGGNSYQYTGNPKGAGGDRTRLQE